MAINIARDMLPVDVTIGTEIRHVVAASDAASLERVYKQTPSA